MRGTSRRNFRIAMLARNTLFLFPGLKVLGLAVFSFASVLQKTGKSMQSSRERFSGSTGYCVIVASPTARPVESPIIPRSSPLTSRSPPVRLPLPSNNRMMLPGCTGSSPVSIAVVPSASRSAITLSSARRLQLLPRFNRFGRHDCDIRLSVPTRGGFYTCKVLLECSHETGDAEIILGSDWIAACSATFCSDRAGLEDPTTQVIASLPTGHYWSPNDGAIAFPSFILLAKMRSPADTHTPCDDSIDVDMIFSELNLCYNDPTFDQSAFFAVRLTREDVMSHFLNSQCAGRKAPGSSEVARGVQSAIRMALTVTETFVVSCERKLISLEELRACCSAIGVTTTQRPEYTVLTQKLKTRCNALQPLLKCDGLETILRGVETLGNLYDIRAPSTTWRQTQNAMRIQ